MLFLLLYLNVLIECYQVNSVNEAMNRIQLTNLVNRPMIGRAQIFWLVLDFT